MNFLTKRAHLPSGAHLRAAFLTTLLTGPLIPVAHAQQTPTQARAGTILLSPVVAQITLTPIDAPPSRDIPAGWREIRGELRTATNTRQSFPAGTQARVTIRDTAAPDRALVTVTFLVSRLPAPYWLTFNPARLQKGHTYTVQATLSSAAGKTLWNSAPTPLPTTPRAVLNLR
ncbi:hypothetical protein GCM10008959_18870 [Deinococcus seoulensis]|uniref:Uncharacterized protein n=1 Tax=Deinococcus seoulensis TaxID=1837379 RepID=A0ABQ2RQE7_9DEIO|nr:YbaY family lipoprotein [Deinococcus seoulensis]GGR57358.1 hypothetical protein GCM10008959_18870 [Deinococcus seoulensis]